MTFAARVAIAYEGEVSRPPTPTAPPIRAPVLTKPPALERAVEAPYPLSLVERQLSGEVVLQIEIAPDGSVPSAEITQSSGVAEFDAAAVDALKQFRFTPAEFDGVPGAVKVEYRYRFVPPLPPAPPQPPPPPPINLRGRVLERGTRDPIADATVFLPDSEISATTRADGSFELRGAPAGQVPVVIRQSEHSDFRTTVEIVEGEVTELTAYQWPKSAGGFETTIRGEREKKEVARRTLERAELTTVPGTFGDPLRVIQNLPGLSRPAFISGDILVRGAAPEDTSVLIDGIPIPLLYHFAGGPSVLNPAFIDRIDFFPGAYGSKYGRAIAGVIDVSTRPAENARLHGNFDIDLLDAGFYLEGPVKEGRDWGTWSLAARRSYLDTFLPYVLDAVRQPGQAAFATTPVYWDYQSRYDLKLGKNRLELLAFGSNDRLSFAQSGTLESTGFSAGTEQGFHRFRMKWSRALDSGWKVSIAPTMGTTLVTFNFNEQVDGNISSWDFNTRASASRALGSTLSLETGVDLNGNLYDLAFTLPSPPEYQTFPGEAPDTESTTRTFGINTFSQAAFVEAVWQPFESLRLVPGLRAELYTLPSGRTPSIEPRIAARWQLSERFLAKAAWGQFRQGPRPMDIDEQTGNPDLALSESRQTVVGFETSLRPALSLDVQGFFNQRDRLVIRSSAIVVRDGVSQSEKLRNGGVGRSYGLEVLLKQALTERFFGWIAYTLTRSEQRSERTGAFIPVATDQTHILTLVGSRRFDGGWEAGARFRLTTGRPETPVVNGVFNADTGAFSRINGEVGSSRGSTFHQLDLRLEKTFTRETWKGSVFLDVQNAYNATNPEFTLFDYRFQQSAGFPGLPIVPTLGVTGAF